MGDTTLNSSDDTTVFVFLAVVTLAGIFAIAFIGVAAAISGTAHATPTPDLLPTLQAMQTQIAAWGR